MRQLRILIVDDDDDLCRVACWILESMATGVSYPAVVAIVMRTSTPDRLGRNMSWQVFAGGLPARLRLRSGETKFLLKRVLRGRVPPEVLDRPKQGFAVPLEAWFSEELPRVFHDVLGEGSRLADVGIRPAAVRSLIELYTARRRQDHCRRLWALAVLDRTLRALRGTRRRFPE